MYIKYNDVIFDIETSCSICLNKFYIKILYNDDITTLFETNMLIKTIPKADLIMMIQHYIVILYVKIVLNIWINGRLKKKN